MENQMVLVRTQSSRLSPPILCEEEQQPFICYILSYS
uniref:Uncharacterized protein MANES_12G142600 n=1 Tax=Rhizophora mucronata TaxID=61149 RepID=A0A2P2LB40_RHIMU